MLTGSFKELTVSCIQSKGKSIITRHPGQEKYPKKGAKIYQRKRIQLVCLDATALAHHSTQKETRQNPKQNPYRIPNPPTKTKEKNPKTPLI